MKLFSPAQSKIVHNQKQDEDITQIAYLSITLKKLQDQINLEQTNFSARMKEQRDLYTSEKEKLQEELKDLEAKVKTKEQKLLELLIPIDGLKERAEETLQRAQEQALSIMEREENIIELEEALANKIDSLTEREIQVAENEIKIENRLKGIEEERLMVSDSHKRLNIEKETFQIESKKIKDFLDEKENVIIAKELRNQEFLEKRTNELNDLERSLKDRREALEREFNRLKNK